MWVGLPQAGWPTGAQQVVGMPDVPHCAVILFLLWSQDPSVTWGVACVRPYYVSGPHNWPSK